jgi:hypothetical protein
VAQQVSQAGLPLWNANTDGVTTVSTPVATSEFAEAHPVAISDGRGGTFVAFEVTSHEGPLAGRSRIWAQHLDANGWPTWNDGVQSVEVGFNPAYVARSPVLVADGRGGVVIVYEVAFTEGEHAGDIDIMAQRIAQFGTPLWGQGRPVASSRMIERAPSVVSDGRGGAIVIFEGEARDGEYVGDSEILAQRINRRGQLVYHGGSRSLVVSAGRVEEKAPVAVSDGRGGVIALFEQHVREGPYEGRVWIAGQRVSRRGRLLWNAGERSVALSLGPYVHSGLRAVSDGRGGAIAVFEGFLAEDGSGGDTDVFAQRIDGRGDLLFGQSGQAVPVAASDGFDGRPELVSDGEGGAIVVFQQDIPDSTSVYLAAQRLDDQGRRIWGEFGERSVLVAKITAADRAVAVSSDGQQGVLVFFEEPLADVAIFDHSVIRGQRLDASGQALWHNGDRAAVVSGSMASEQNPAVAQH